ncbi:MAG: BrxA/BrxB family bacilliredoxin [Chitinophagales bacterium]|jgi:putative YphP/YqiW family bacilliredoxin|nr:BrxA/BrxB family bacilliredoxin [Chitinophagales bacterium]
MYPPELVNPMKAELHDVGFKDLTSSEEVKNALETHKEGTMLILVNSVCGCAAGAARPGLKAAVSSSDKKPDALYSVFAGVDKDAVQTAREFFLPYPPTSPSMALFKDGKLVHFVERHQIEGNIAQTIAEHWKKVFEVYC